MANWKWRKAAIGLCALAAASACGQQSDADKALETCVREHGYEPKHGLQIGSDVADHIVVRDMDGEGGIGTLYHMNSGSVTKFFPSSPSGKTRKLDDPKLQAWNVGMFHVMERCLSDAEAVRAAQSLSNMLRPEPK